MYVHMHVRACVHMHVYAHMHVRTHACAYTCTYMYTLKVITIHVHTCILLLYTQRHTVHIHTPLHTIHVCIVHKKAYSTPSTFRYMRKNIVCTHKNQLPKLVMHTQQAGIPMHQAGTSELILTNPSGRWDITPQKAIQPPLTH